MCSTSSFFYRFPSFTVPSRLHSLMVILLCEVEPLTVLASVSLMFRFPLPLPSSTSLLCNALRQWFSIFLYRVHRQSPLNTYCAAASQLSCFLVVSRFFILHIRVCLHHSVTPTPRHTRKEKKKNKSSTRWYLRCSRFSRHQPCIHRSRSFPALYVCVYFVQLASGAVLIFFFYA